MLRLDEEVIKILNKINEINQGDSKFDMTINELKEYLSIINESINDISFKLNKLRENFNLYMLDPKSNKIIIHDASDSIAECLSRAIENLEEAEINLKLIYK